MKNNYSSKLLSFLMNISCLFLFITHSAYPLKAFNETSNINENLVIEAPNLAKYNNIICLNILEFPKEILDSIIEFSNNKKNLARSSSSFFSRVTNYNFDYTFYNSSQCSEIKKFLENQEQNAYKNYILRTSVDDDQVLINLPLNNEQRRNIKRNFRVFWLFQESKILYLPNWGLNLLNYSRVQHLELQEELNKDQLQLIAAHPTITSLDAPDIEIDDESIKILSKNKRFKYLNLSRNKITIIGIKYLENIEMLHHLDLSNININGSVELLKNIRRLNHLNLSNSKVTHTDIQKLSNIKMLNHLDLSYNNIVDEEVKDLANIKTLTYLDLSNNDVGYLGAQYLGSMTNLINLRLRCNNIGDTGAKSLANNTSLNFLDIERNKIHNGGAKALANMTNLISLTLGHNYVGNSGAKALAESTSLTSLYLKNNKINNDGIQAFEKNKKLAFLDLRYNPSNDNKIQALAASL